MRFFLELCVLALVICMAVFLLVWVTGGFERIERVQKFRTEFSQRCADRQGKIITLRKSNVSRVCVGPDGRWLEYY